MYGTKASQLLKDFAANEPGQLASFSTDAFKEVIKECGEHHLALQGLMRKIQEEGLDIQATRNADHFGAVVNHLALIRNKRCLMAYVYNRAEIIQNLRWKVGSLLPQEIHKKINYSEAEYFKNFTAALDSYMSVMGIDLTVDMVPPKDPYIKVRVLDDIGGVMLSEQYPNLSRHSIHFLRRTDAEPFISQGLMEELPS